MKVILVCGPTGSGKTTYSIRLARTIGADPEIHYLSAPADRRRQRVEKRNQEKDPDVYSFEVTDFMFDFMEPGFEVPGEDELGNSRTIAVEESRSA